VFKLAKVVLAIFGASLTVSCSFAHFDFPLVQSPRPVIDHSTFVQSFADICLLDQRTDADVKKAAQRLGLKPNLERAYGLWEAPKERGHSPLTLQTRSHDVISEYRGNPSKIPIRVHICSLAAHLDEENADVHLTKTVSRRLSARAKTVNFETIAEGAELSPNDIKVELQRSSLIYDSRKGVCSGSEACSYQGPTKLTLEIVLRRSG
jgi:hypothetical protein